MTSVRRLDQLAFLPRPRRVQSVEGTCARRNVSARVDPGWGHRQGYHISIRPLGIEVIGSDPPGLAYGLTTLGQAERECGRTIPCGEIEDWPGFPIRGVMLDVSRDKVPSMETLQSLVQMLAELKYNHIELYMEHTFAYSRHKEVWAHASPLTAAEIRRLDALCRSLHIDLVPNQNSFGHLHRWLSLPRYRRLAECPDGFNFPWGQRSREPFSLAPTEAASIDFLDELYGELLPCFSSALFNVGLDETYDLGQGRSREECERRGKGAVYLDFLKRVHELVSRHGRTMLYWGDIIAQHPRLIPELPRDAVALEWGYEADHPFESHAEMFEASGVPWWVCPGTSSWNSIAGRTDNCMGNMHAAAEAGLKHGASGFLVTDWGDNGHMQTLPVSFLGLAAGAAAGWCVESSAKVDVARALDVHIFEDAAGRMGSLSRHLGNAYLTAGDGMKNASPLFHFINPLADAPLPHSVTASSLRETRAQMNAMAGAIEESRMARADARLIKEEYGLTLRMLLHACDRGIAVLEGTLADPAAASRLKADMAALTAAYRRIWKARNRPGGLSQSVGRLERLY